MLADGCGNFIEITLCRSVRCRLNLEISWLETTALSDMLRAIDRIGDLKLFKSYFLRTYCLLILRLKGNIGVFWAFQTTRGILGAFLSHGVEVRTFRNQTVVALVLIDNSIKWAYVILRAGHNLAIELEARLGQARCSLLSTSAWRDTPFQIELARVLILSRLGVHADNSARIIRNTVLAFVAHLGVVAGSCYVSRRRGPGDQSLRGMLSMNTSFDR